MRVPTLPIPRMEEDCGASLQCQPELYAAEARAKRLCLTCLDEWRANLTAHIDREAEQDT